MGSRRKQVVLFLVERLCPERILAGNHITHLRENAYGSTYGSFQSFLIKCTTNSIMKKIRVSISVDGTAFNPLQIYLYYEIPQCRQTFTSQSRRRIPKTLRMLSTHEYGRNSTLQDGKPRNERYKSPFFRQRVRMRCLSGDLEKLETSTNCAAV